MDRATSYSHSTAARQRLAGHTSLDLVCSPVEIEQRTGPQVSGSDGNAYLDCGGFGVFLLGHCHPTVVAAVRRQLERNPLATRLFLNPELAQAAEDLAAVAPAGLDHVFLTNSGAEATELGLKLARLNGRSRVVAMTGGFHGKTLGALSVTGRSQYRDPFGPLLPQVEFVPFGDLEALTATLAVDPAGSAVLMEPVQGEGGVRVPPAAYLQGVRATCTATGALMVLDEIQTGLGRLGDWWGADLAGVVPDVLLTGKVLGGGVMPVGGVIAGDKVFAPLDADPLLHSSTFAGSPLASVAVSATVGVVALRGPRRTGRPARPRGPRHDSGMRSSATARTSSARCAASGCWSASTSSRPRPPPSSSSPCSTRASSRRTPSTPATSFA